MWSATVVSPNSSFELLIVGRTPLSMPFVKPRPPRMPPLTWFVLTNLLCFNFSNFFMVLLVLMCVCVCVCVCVCTSGINRYSLSSYLPLHSPCFYCRSDQRRQ